MRLGVSPDAYWELSLRELDALIREYAEMRSEDAALALNVHGVRRKDGKPYRAQDLLRKQKAQSPQEMFAHMQYIAKLSRRGLPT